MRMKSVKVNSILNMLRMMLTVLVPLITFPYTSRIFGAEGTGQINFANSVTQVLALIASLGIYTYGIREGTKCRSDRNKLSSLAQELLSLNFVSTSIAYILFFVLLFTVEEMKTSSKMLLLHSINIVFTGLGIDWIYGVEEDYGYITLRQIVIQSIQIALLLMFVHDRSDIYTWVLITVLCSSIGNILNVILSHKYIDLFPIRVTWNTIKRHVMPVSIFFATQLAGKAYLYIDTTMLGILSTDYAVGIYSAATKINTILLTCFAAMYPVFLPRVVSTLNGCNHFVFLNNIFKVIIALALPCTIGLATLSYPIITVVAGDGFVDAATTMVILAPIVLLNTITVGIQNLVLVPHSKEDMVFAGTAITAIINIVSSAMLVPHFNENGAAIGSLIAELVNIIFSYGLMIRVDSRYKECFKGNLNYIVGAIIIGIYCTFIQILTTDNIICFIVGILGSVCLYVLWLIFRKDEIWLEVKKNLKERKWRK